MRKLWRLEPVVERVFAHFKSELGEVHFYVSDLRWSTEHNQNIFTGYAIAPNSERPVELKVLESQLLEGDWLVKEKMVRVRGFSPRAWPEIRSNHFPSLTAS
jgi:hypothetical protein